MGMITILRFPNDHTKYDVFGGLTRLIQPFPYELATLPAGIASASELKLHDVGVLLALTTLAVDERRPERYLPGITQVTLGPLELAVIVQAIKNQCRGNLMKLCEVAQLVTDLGEYFLDILDYGATEIWHTNHKAQFDSAWAKVLLLLLADNLEPLMMYSNSPHKDAYDKGIVSLFESTATLDGKAKSAHYFVHWDPIWHVSMHRDTPSLIHDYLHHIFTWTFTNLEKFTGAGPTRSQVAGWLVELETRAAVMFDGYIADPSAAAVDTLTITVSKDANGLFVLQ